MILFIISTIATSILLYFVGIAIIEHKTVPEVINELINPHKYIIHDDTIKKGGLLLKEVFHQYVYLNQLIPGNAEGLINCLKDISKDVGPVIIEYKYKHYDNQEEDIEDISKIAILVPDNISKLSIANHLELTSDKTFLKVSPIFLKEVMKVLSSEEEELDMDEECE